MREYIGRFSKYMELKGLNDNQVTKQCNLAQGLLSQARTGKSDLGKRTREKILETYQDLSRVWLLTGEGEMLNAVKAPAPEQPVKADFTLVPLIPEEAVAGYLGNLIEGVNIFDCRRIPSPFPGAEIAIQVSGDSMNPEIKSGDRLYLRKIDSAAFIPWGHTLVLDTVNGAVVKEIQPCSDDEECLMAISVNPKFPPYKIEKSAIRGIYRILGTITINSTF